MLRQEGKEKEKLLAQNYSLQRKQAMERFLEDDLEEEKAVKAKKPIANKIDSQAKDKSQGVLRSTHTSQ